jgi:hypothetical protein
MYDDFLSSNHYDITFHGNSSTFSPVDTVFSSGVIPLTAPKMSGGFPKNFQELQKQLAKAQEQGRRFGAGGGGGAPRGALGGLAGLIILGGGAVVLSNSLFNGRNDDTSAEP